MAFHKYKGIFALNHPLCLFFKRSCEISGKPIEEIHEEERVVTDCCRDSSGEIKLCFYALNELKRWIGFQTSCPHCGKEFDMDSFKRLAIAY